MENYMGWNGIMEAHKTRVYCRLRMAKFCFAELLFEPDLCRTYDTTICRNLHTSTCNWRSNAPRMQLLSFNTERKGILSESHCQ